MASDSPPPPYDACMIEDDSTDILVRVAYRNQVRSPLLQLPDGMLTVIMAGLDLDCILRLRHTSRTFMRLFSTAQSFKKYHLTPQQDKERFESTGLIWTPPYSFFPAQAASWYGTICPSCSLKRSGDLFGKELFRTMPSLYCVACRTSHKEIYFSMTQRALPETGNRICIGHEGSFYLCDHIDPFAWYQAISKESIPGMECMSELHSSGQPHCDGELCDYSRQPLIQVGRDSEGGRYLELWYSQHLSVERLPSGKMCANSLRKALEDLRPGMGLVAGLPCFWPVAGDPLRIFDPNICDCVEWRGVSPDVKPVRWVLCPDPAKPWRESANANIYVSTKARCSSFNHGRRFWYKGIPALIEFARCPDNDDLLVLVQSVKYYINEACGSDWDNVLCGPLYDREGDEDMRGVTWCSRPKCAVSKLLQNGMHSRNMKTTESLG